MLRVERREKRLVGIVSVVLALGVFLSALASTFLLKARLAVSWDDFAIVAIIVGLFPPAIVNFLDTRWRNGVDKNIPRLLSEVANAGRTGVTLTRAIELASERRYGPLTKELKRLVAKLSWGVPLEDALESFSKRVDTPLAKRTAILIAEASRSGQNIQEIMESINKHIGDLHVIEVERRSQIRPYMGIIYLAFLVFLVTDVILVKTFFVQIDNLRMLMEQKGIRLLGFGGIDLPTIKKIFYHMAAVQGFFGGLVAGKMGEGTMGAGLKHSLILLITSLLTFYLFVWT